ncbi:MAG TPA: hypothetical protein VM509_07555 [Planctomycetota bacterium]|nr:hypothetical protein [Planctomycetota bacterium]
MWIQSGLAAAVLSLTGGQALVSSAAPSNPLNLVFAHHGPAAGHWRLPDAAGPGEMLGRLFSPTGVALMEVHAQILPPPTGSAIGQIDGIVTKLVGANPGPIGEFHGQWRSNTLETGDFIGQIIRPGQNGNPPVLLGRVRGHFLDPQGPALPDAHFHGRWKF